MPFKFPIVHNMYNRYQNNNFLVTNLTSFPPDGRVCVLSRVLCHSIKWRIIKKCTKVNQAVNVHRRTSARPISQCCHAADVMIFDRGTSPSVVNCTMFIITFGIRLLTIYSRLKNIMSIVSNDLYFCRNYFSIDFPWNLNSICVLKFTRVETGCWSLKETIDKGRKITYWRRFMQSARALADNGSTGDSHLNFMHFLNAFWLTPSTFKNTLTSAPYFIFHHCWNSIEFCYMIRFFQKHF